jgi:hypothetical protein
MSKPAVWLPHLSTANSTAWDCKWGFIISYKAIVSDVIKAGSAEPKAGMTEIS